MYKIPFPSPNFPPKSHSPPIVFPIFQTQSQFYCLFFCNPSPSEPYLIFPVKICPNHCSHYTTSSLSIYTFKDILKDQGNKNWGLKTQTKMAEQNLCQEYPSALTCSNILHPRCLDMAHEKKSLSIENSIPDKLI